jgi:hypothetical protein
VFVTGVDVVVDIVHSVTISIPLLELSVSVLFGEQPTIANKTDVNANAFVPLSRKLRTF